MLQYRNVAYHSLHEPEALDGPPAAERREDLLAVPVPEVHRGQAGRGAAAELRHSVRRREEDGGDGAGGARPQELVLLRHGAAHVVPHDDHLARDLAAREVGLAVLVPRAEDGLAALEDGEVVRGRRQQSSEDAPLAAEGEEELAVAADAVPEEAKMRAAAAGAPRRGPLAL